MTTELTQAATAGREQDAGPVLEVSGLDVSYGRGRRRRRALHGVSLSVAPGETVGVIGETGSGKSTSPAPFSAWFRPRPDRSSSTGRT